MRSIERVPVQTDTRAPTDSTNAYVIGADAGVLVDPAEPSAELDRVVDERDPSRVLATHTHRDHVGGIEHYARRNDLDVLARAGYVDRFERATGIAPDAAVRDGDVLTAGRLDVHATATPGHAPDHLALTVVRSSNDARRAVAAPGARVLVGDLAIAEGSVVVGPPDGDVRAYLTALRRLHARNPRELLPGHGPPIDRPRATLRRLVEHRLVRERRVLEAVRSGASTPDAVVTAAYDKDLTGVEDLARATVIGHLEKLAVEGAVRWNGQRARPA